ncbi:MAG: DUF5681 domain-containing protein [Planctomycetaceae bacterium]
MDDQAQGPRAGGGPPWLRQYQFRPGQSGNPGGRPKNLTLTDRLRRVLDQASPSGETIGDGVVRVLVELAVAGDRRAILDIFERVDGKVPPVVEATHDEAYAGAAEIIRARQSGRGPG